jgi:hypothetical protein
VALSYVTQSIFVPAATLARGSGRPGLVTAVILVCGLVMVVVGAALIPRSGLAGVGIAYVLASLPPAIGTVYIARQFFEDWSPAAFGRAVICPLAVGTVVFGLIAALRRWTGDLNIAAFLLFGSMATCGTAALLLLAEEILGGHDSRTRLVVAQIRRRLGAATPAIKPQPDIAPQS